MKTRRFVMRVLVALCWSVVAGPPAAAQLLLNGAGATFPYPLYSKWFNVYAEVDPSVRFNYQSIGSGGGIKQITEQTVDFGATDGPMSDTQLQAAPRPILHFPTVIGAVVLTYHLPGVGGGLKLTPEAIAGIFFGTITKWNDPALTTINPERGLPNADIIVVHRADGSGTSYIFTDYLSTISNQWRTKVGRGTSVRWPTGLAGKGNEGVTGLVKQTPNAIGYVELTYALSNSLPVADLKNQSGVFVTPSMDSVTAAAAGLGDRLPEDFRVSIVNAPAAAAYPISGMTWLLVYERQTDVTKGKKLVEFLRWMLRDGQRLAPDLHYAPLPTEVVEREQQALRKITGPDGAPLLP